MLCFSAGEMHSLHYFNSTLSDNLITELARAPPTLHTQPECLCPPSHPTPLEQECEDPTGTFRIPRLNAESRDPTRLNDGDQDTWWESAIGEAPVNVTVSLGGLRTALVVGVTFRSLLPESMVLYYSTNGVDFETRQYYSSDCSRFNLPNNGLLTHTTDVNCVTMYSRPRTNQVVSFRVLDGSNRPGATATNYRLNMDLQEFSQATHIRLELINWNSDSLLEQYFAIDEVQVYGQECVCNGHSDACDESLCVCSHSTTGENCEQCLPLYNDKPWAPGTPSSSNQCELCACNNHSVSCSYNSTIDSGTCNNCLDNTRGFQCESCIDFYYHLPGVDINDPNTCAPCDCHMIGTDEADCGRRDNIDGTDSGQCSCAALVTGRRCDQCIDGTFNLTLENPDGCQTCRCDARGTIDGSTSCDQQTGQCECKSNVIERDCSSCAANHFGLEGQEGCVQCHQECVECSGPSNTECQVSDCCSQYLYMIV